MAAPSSEGRRAIGTLFVRNVPYTATDEEFENTFSEIGPLKKCFLVRDRQTKECRGFGYISYALRQDTEKAQNSVFKISGRKLTLDLANSKDKKRKHNKEDEGTPEVKKIKADTSPTSGVPSYTDTTRTLVVSGIPENATKEDIEKVVKRTNNVEQICFPVEENKQKVAHIRYVRCADAKNAIGRIKGKKFLGTRLTADILSRKTKTFVHMKKSRLIVRNISFKCDEEDLKNTFSSFGEITEVCIPKMEDGRMFGYGFVQYGNVIDAAQAVKKLNMTMIKGRTVAVDWAVPKLKYEDAMKQEKEKAERLKNEKKTETVEQSSNKKNTPKAQKEDKQRSKSSAKNDQNKQIIQKNVKPSKNQKDENSVKSLNKPDNLLKDKAKRTAQTIPENNKIKKQQIKDKKISKPEKKSLIEDDGDKEDGYHSDSDGDVSSECSVDEDDDDVDSDDEDDDDDEEEEEDDDDDDDEEKFSMKPKRPSDASEGKTLFVRNIPFDAQEEDVTELFGKHGKVNYCKLVIDPSTEHSRGCAFVKFRSSTEAEKCLEKNSNEDGVNGFMLNGRKLHLSMALSKEEAEKLKKDKKEPKEKKDKRNLYLAREGMIRPGTKAAEGVSKGDMMKRFKMEKVKRQKLQNLNIFVSPTRLSVHNLPTSVDNKKLRELFWKAAGDDKAKIIEARVMRDMGRVNSRGVPKSLGYAFIEFTEHEHALKALRHVNNNPEIYEPIKRPIVEFSLENKLALQVKERRKQKVSAKLNEEGASGKKPMITKTKFETAAKIMDGTKEKVRKGMPSHMGPKVRWRDRKNKLPVAKKPKDKMSREKSRGMKMNSDARVVQPMKVKTKKKSGKRKGAPGDDFDRMVQNYQKSKLSRTRQTKKVKKTKSKWFE